CKEGEIQGQRVWSQALAIPRAAWPPLKLVNPFCAMKADDGPCKAIHKRYFFNIKNRKCEVFEYGGCHGNDNNFLTLEECQEKCAPAVHHLALFLGMPDFCYDPQEPGVCRGYFTRYFYNKETKSCEAFKYGGCLGNQNNFRTLEECQTVCRDNFNLLPTAPNDKSNTLNSSSPKKEPNQFPIFFEPPAIPSLCMTPMDSGLCRAKELRFFYNHSTGRCRPFSYSGCGGNENNFISRKSCLRICKKGMGSDSKKGERRLIKIKKKRKKQPVKSLGIEIIPERAQL
uniref:Tissue factor pathway inhibitor n=1 Tax=Catharus ustulatus TaxID=91951 RepID=A0A8C3V8Q9_CATUS